jgi:hypothetical protein
MINKNRNFQVRDDQTLFDMMRLYNNTSAQFQPFYDEQTELFDFTVGALQWDKQVRATLRKENRPANSYNLIRTILNVVFSVERDNRKKGKASPRTGGDNDLANVVTQTLDYYLYHSGFAEAQKRVFMDAIVARLGVYHVGWEYNGSEDQIGNLFTRAVDPREMMFEPNYNDPLWKESAFVMRKHSMNVEEMLNTFALNDGEMQQSIMKEAALFFEKDKKRSKWVTQKLKSLFNAVYETATGVDSYDDHTNYLKWWDPYTGKFDVLELHEKRMEKRLVVPEGNKLVDLTDVYSKEYESLEGKAFNGMTYDNEIINRLRKNYQLKGQATEDLVNRRFQTIVIPTFMLKVSEQPYPFDSPYYVYLPQYCYDTHADPMKLQSIMDDLVDPQADFNKSKSLILELLGRYANKGWIMDENAISGLEDDWSTNKIAPYRRVRAGYINMVRPEEGQTISPELVKMPLEMQQLMKVITNADDEIRGNRSAGVNSGKHFLAKEERQAKSFTFVLENRDMAQRALYEQSLAFIQHYATTQQVIRVVSDIGNAKGQPVTINKSEFAIEQDRIVERVINDIDAYKYDIEITDEPYSATAQQDRYEKLGDLFNATVAVNADKANALLDILVEVGNFPEAQKILSAWSEIGQPSQEEAMMQQMAMQLQQIMAQLGIEEKKAEIDETKAKTEAKEVEVIGKQLDNTMKKLEIRDAAIQSILGQLEPTNGKTKKA